MTDILLDHQTRPLHRVTHDVHRVRLLLLDEGTRGQMWQTCRYPPAVDEESIMVAGALVSSRLLFPCTSDVISVRLEKENQVCVPKASDTGILHLFSGARQPARCLNVLMYATSSPPIPSPSACPSCSVSRRGRACAANEPKSPRSSAFWLSVQTAPSHEKLQSHRIFFDKMLSSHLSSTAVVPSGSTSSTTSGEQAPLRPSSILPVVQNDSHGDVERDRISLLGGREGEMVKGDGSRRGLAFFHLPLSYGSVSILESCEVSLNERPPCG